MRENDESRKKITHVPEEEQEEGEIDMSDMMAGIKEVEKTVEARRKHEQS